MSLGAMLNFRHGTFRNDHLQLLRSLVQFDVSYIQYLDENYGNHQKYRNRTVLAFFFMLSVTNSSILAFDESNDLDWFLLLPKVIDRINSAWCSYSITIHAMEIKIRYDNLNSHLKNLGKDGEKPISLDPLKTETLITSKLYYVNRLHYKLYRIISRFSDIYSIPMLIIIFISICITVTDFYYIYKMMFLEIEDLSKTYAVLHGCQIVMRFLELAVLVEACFGVCESANSTPVLLHQYRNDFYNNKIDSHIQMYSLQHLHQKVFINVLGFLEVDLSTLYTVSFKCKNIDQRIPPEAGQRNAIIPRPKLSKIK
ncbi:unnamed protein product [Acanthoscelides obtectus]|uniref:Gustatory receptor n=1 Tax=Acanthoscelides obtectus TaxID=200917 RepID=A0A9P0KIV8_ACAOB|nr:unnamed protein product [Acanthoscelides obtectus]CAK1664808.1 hypothetical protein AOBTE_LOCUS24478 [Acanthoscelides obtectus]